MYYVIHFKGKATISAIILRHLTWESTVSKVQHWGVDVTPKVAFPLIIHDKNNR